MYFITVLSSAWYTLYTIVCIKHTYCQDLFVECTQMAGWDKINQTGNDLSHQILNNVVDLLYLISDKDKYNFTEPKQLFAQDIGRSFKRGQNNRFPWQASNKVIKKIDALCKQLRLPNSSRLCKPFRYASYLKTFECMLLAGPVGIYLLQFLDIEDDYFHLFRRFLDVMDTLQSKTIVSTTLIRTHTQIRELLTE